MNKSFVTMEQHVCAVCGVPFDTGNILMHKRLQPVFDSKTVTDVDLCPEHQKLFDAGYIALVECDESRSTMSGNNINVLNAYRLGRVVHVKRNVFSQLFNVSVNDEAPMVFAQSDIIDHMIKLQEQAK